MEWKQQNVIHCPNNECDGMLLESIYRHELKCSRCGKFWMEKTEWIEVQLEE